jgi:hypothetical protein
MGSIEAHDFDVADYAAMGLVAIPVLTYLTILTRQHRMLRQSTYRVQVNLKLNLNLNYSIGNILKDTVVYDIYHYLFNY